jgi:hypothetical protein
LPSNPTPIRLLVQEISVEFKADLKKLYTQSQFPIATARGKIQVTGKCKVVDYSPTPINQLFWAQNQASGMDVFVDNEAHTIPAVSFTVNVTNNTTWDVDNGVQFTSGNAAGAYLTLVSGIPVSGQYNVSSGTYGFAAADSGDGVIISYTYTNATRGQTITLTNQLMGYAPVCRVDVWNGFRNKVLGIRLNSCTFGQYTYPTKLEDFWVSDMSFEANTDASNNLGKIFADSF